MSTCKTCAHWGPKDASLVKGDGFGECRMTVGSNRGSMADEPTLAYAADSENYWAVLCTSPDFGCVQHKPAR